MLAKPQLARLFDNRYAGWTNVLAKKGKPRVRWPRQIPLPQVLALAKSQANN